MYFYCLTFLNYPYLPNIWERVCLHQEALDFFRVKTMLWKKFINFLSSILIILSNIEESTIGFSDFHFFRVQR